MSQIESTIVLYFTASSVGIASLILLRKKIKEAIRWILGWTTDSCKSSRVRLLWEFNGSRHTLGMDKDGNLELPPRGVVYWRRHDTRTPNLYKFSCKPVDTEYYLAEQFGHHANQVLGQRTMNDYWFQRTISDKRKNVFLLQSYNDNTKDVPWKDGRFFTIEHKGSNKFEFKLDDYKSALEYGRFTY